MISERFRKELKAFRPYVPGKPVEEVMREYGLTEIDKLASNENQLGPSPLAVEAVKRVAAEIYLYPEASAIDLKRDIAAYYGIGVESLVVGSGGEELLFIIAQTFINEGDEVVVPAPSFGIYNTTTSLLGAVIRTVPFKGKEYDIPGMLAAVNDKTKLVYICSPNNPTGHIATREELDELYAGLPEDVAVVLDEAYFEFGKENPAYPNGLEYLAKHPNTLVLRTFSKIDGIAGLRIGYVITSEEIAKEMNKVKQTFTPNRVAQEAARAALKDKEHRIATIAMNQKSLATMEAAFQEWGLDFFKSYANFIFVDVKTHSSRVFEELLKKGTIIRPGYFWGWDNWIRVSTGTEEQTSRFLQRLKEVLNEE